MAFSKVVSILTSLVRRDSEAAKSATDPRVRREQLRFMVRGKLVERMPNLVPVGEAVVEIRKLMDIEDFGDGFIPNPEIANVKYK